MIDWILARAHRRLSSPAPRTAAAPRADLPALAADAERRVIAYTSSSRLARCPSRRAISAREWIAANSGSMRPLLDPVAERAGDGMGLLGRPRSSRPGCARRAGRRADRLPRPARARPVRRRCSTLDAPARACCSSPQPRRGGRPPRGRRRRAPELGDAPRGHARRAVHRASRGCAAPRRAACARSSSSAEVRIDAAAEAAPAARTPTCADSAQRCAAATSSRSSRAASGARSLDRLQATMAVDRGPRGARDGRGRRRRCSPRRRSCARARTPPRRSRPGLSRLLERLLGLELKLRQYRDGKRFCDAVVDAAGIEALHHVFSAPDALPTLAELADPTPGCAVWGSAANCLSTPRNLSAWIHRSRVRRVANCSLRPASCNRAAMAGYKHVFDHRERPS